VLIFAVVLVAAFYASAGLATVSFALMVAVMEFGFFLLPVLATVAAKGYPFRQTLSLRLPAWQGWAGGVLVGVSGWVPAMLTLRILPPPESLAKALERVLLFQDHPQPLWVIWLLAALTPALCEESLFRGLILSGFRGLGKWPAILATAFLFGLAHASIYRLMPTGLLGVVFGYAVWQTGSLVPSVVAHALNNGLMLTLAFSPKLMESMGLNGARQMPLWLVGVGGLVLASGLLLLRSAGERNFAGDRPSPDAGSRIS
jgi:sodium transport system permease protein